MTITTANFVSVGFTLKVWRAWVRKRVLGLRPNPQVLEPHQGGRVIWIFGSGRSGTTWLMELLQRGYNLHAVFEFFHLDNPDLGADPTKKATRLASDVREIGLEPDLVRRAAASEFRNAWINRTNSLNPFRRYDGVVLKDIAHRLEHAPALLAEVTAAEPVIMLRQPSAMLRSLITANEIWQKDSLFNTAGLKESLEANRDLLSDHALQALQASIAEVELGRHRAEQIEVARWCFQNLTALERLSGDPRLRVVIYERINEQYLQETFGPFIADPRMGKRSSTDWGRKPSQLAADTLAQTAQTLAIFGLGPFALPDAPHLLDLEALVADYRRAPSARLTPRFMR